MACGRMRPGRETRAMKYLTTLEVAHELKISKQTLLNWLYSGKVPEPPRNKMGYRLWSPSRVSLVRKLIGDAVTPRGCRAWRAERAAFPLPGATRRSPRGRPR